MGLFDKFKRKADKSKRIFWPFAKLSFNKFKVASSEAEKRPAQDKKEKQKKVSSKIQAVAENKEGRDLTLAELKEKELAVQEGKAQKVAEKKAAKKVAKDDTKRAYKILVRPLVTEKGTYLASESKYIFAVKGKANKIEIKKAIEAVYGVSPVKVNLVKLPGKRVRYGRVRGRTKDRKKAIVTLKPGETIEVYEGV